ncbi:site-2 protease family protein [bacterium]|nr:site-2 protease family protein [bacterium]
MFTEDFILWIALAVPSIVVASTIHEYFHAWCAFKLGDPTAKASGRLTLNPLAHIDPIGALMMVIFRFGWSKPIPINEYNFERRRQDTALTALAGPVSNLVVAILTAILYQILPDWYLISYFLFIFATINLSLAIFNMIPVPPLDGHKIVNGLLPKGLSYYWEKLESYSWVLILLFILPFSPLSTFISSFIGSTLDFFLTLLGFL